MTFRAPVSGRMFTDSNGDQTENDGNGGFEAGIAGQTVQLFNAHGSLLQTTQTDQWGNYSFGDVLYGDYYVQFPATVAGASLVNKDVGNSATDSDGNVGTGRTDIFHVNATSDTTQVDAGYMPPAASGPNGVAVDGENFAEVMTPGYDDSNAPTDSGGDIIDGADGIDDTILGNGGDDTIDAGLGDDLVSGGSGDDSIDGNDGSDTIYGDQSDAVVGDGERESFNWQGISDTQADGSFTQDTGNVTVTYTRTQDTGTHNSTVEDSTLLNTAGIDGGGETVDNNSSLYSETHGAGNTGEFQWAFSDPVSDVEFNVNDLDGDGLVTVRAFDAAGNEIPVTLTGGSDINISGNVADAEGPYQDPNDPDITVQVNIAGPVSRIELEHTQNGHDNSGINITDLYYDAGGITDDSTVAGDDTIDGGDGDDLIYGDNGNSQSAGGSGVLGDTLGDGPGSTGGGYDRISAQSVYNGNHSFSTDAFYLGNDIPVLDDANRDAITGVSFSQDGVGTDRTFGLDELEFTGAQRSFVGLVTVQDSDVWGANDQFSSSISGGFQDTSVVSSGTADFTMNDGEVFEGIRVNFVRGPDGETYMMPDDGPSPDAFNAFKAMLANNTSGIKSFTIATGSGDDNGINPIEGNWADGQFFELTEGDGDGGDDVIEGGLGEDTMFGEGGNDTFIVGSAAEGAGDVIDGGNGPDETTDNDVLDLRGAGPVTINDAADANDDGATAGTVTFEDGSTLEFEGIETILTDPTNIDPTAVEDQLFLDEDASITFDPTDNDLDPDGDPLTVTNISDPANGTLTDNGDGTYTYTPDENYNGVDSVTYTVSDGQGGTDTTTVTFSVAPVNDAPDAVNDAIETDEEVPVTIDVLVNDTDVDGDPLTITAATVPTDQGTVEIVNNELVFTPADDFFGEATISYSIEDGNGGTDVAEVAVTVNNINDDPVAVDDIADTDEDTPVTIDLLANDEDVDGDPLTIASVSVPPEQGTVVDNGDGTVTFTPAPDFNGPATITYTVDDGQGGTDEGEATVNVSSVIDPPVAIDDTAETDEDTPVTIDVVANDTDPDGDPLTITAATVPADQGTVEIVNNELVFTPAPDFNGDATITYSIEDGNGGTDSAEVAVVVNPVNDDPVALDDIENTDEDVPVIVDLLGNDTDVDGDPLTLASVSVDPAEGTVVDNGDGTVTFTPAQDFNGPVEIAYTVSDGQGGTDDAVALVNVGAVNDSPIAVDDSDTTAEDTAITVDLIANDSDPDGDPLTVISATVPADQGTVVDNGDGTVTFTPAQDFNGEATISYTISDGNGLTSSAEHVVTVTPEGDAPVTEDDTAETDEDTPVTIDPLANDTDPDGQPLSISGTPTAPNGTVTVNPDGTIEYTPDPDFNGEDTITYVATDPDGNQTPGTITVTVAPVNDAPDAVNDAIETDEEVPVTIDVLVNDTDVDGDPLTITAATVPTDQGTVEIVNNELVFTPADDFFGEATISYSIEDGNGGTDVAEVAVTVNNINDDPVAVDDIADTDEDTPVTIDLLANDEDVDGDPLTIASVSVPPEQGTVVDNGDGTVTFTPAPDFNGPATITYTVDDGQGGTDEGEATVNVSSVIDPPVAIDDTAETDEDTPVTIDVVANDTDPDGDPLTITAATVPADQGTVEIVNNELVFTPAPDFNGDATITYSIEDGNGGTDSAEVAVVVNPVNDDPVALDDIENTDEDVPVIVDLLGNDTDVDGDPLTLASVSVDPAEGTVVDNGDGTVTFTPAQDFNGPVEIAYTVSDGQGGTDDAVALVNVGAVNDSPIAVDDSDTTAEDTAITVDLIANDSDPDGDPLTVISATVPADQGTVVDNGDGTVTFTPAQDFNGEATISYTISDGNGLTSSAEHVVTVTPEGDAPVTEDDTAETDEDTPVTIDPLANDTDPDGQPLSISGTPTAPNGTVTVNPDGTIEYTPDPDFNGEDTITYVATDPDGNQTPGTITVTVAPVNDAPDAVNDAIETDEEVPVTIDVLVNDTDVDGDPLTITAATVPTDQGTVEIVNNELVFTPADDFFGEATISYSIEDGNGGTDVAEVAVTVNNINDDPVAVDDIADTDEDTPVTIDLLANDEDVDGDPLTIASVSVPPEQGTVVDNGDGTVTFTPAPDFNGPATITYTVDDGQGGTDEGEATVNVSSVIDPPVAIDDTAETDEDTPVTIDVVANDTDPDGDPLTITAATVPADQGTVEIVNNELVFTPAPDFNGDATITYSIEDGNGGTDSAEVAVVVNPVNDDPVALDDIENTDEDVPVIVDLLGNDTDVDGDPLTLASVSVDPAEGTVVDNGDGTVTFTPAQDFNGPVEIAYTVSDGQGGTDDAVALVNVGAVNDSPIAVDDSDTTAEDTAITVDLIANDSDPDGDPLTVISATVPADQGTVVDNGDGTVTFTPAQDFNGEATISYTISDGNGLTSSAEHVVTVTPEGDAPVTEDDTAETDEDTPVTIDPLANDTDPDGQPLSISGTPTAPNGTVTVNPDGTIEYTPDPDFNGEDTITYVATDPDGNETPGTITVTVAPVNDDPVANDDTATTPFNTPVTIPVLDNDTDVDGDPLTVTEATSPDGDVTINPDGTITFTPTDGFEGPATITYTVSDPDGATDTGTVTLTVEDQPLDGIVEGTDGDDLIDVNYDGDPEGDKVDNNDEILPGEGPNDDIIEAGDGNDTVIAGEGDDDVLGGAGEDDIDGGEGDDLLDGGDDDDTITGGDGRDTVDGGDGDDVIDTGNGDILPDIGFPGLPPVLGSFDPDADPEDDRDSVDGGAGNDTISTGDDRDTIEGGDGDDVIDAGIDDDIVDGGEDDDRIVGGEGNDLIEGGAGDDTIYAGNDPDLGLDVLNIEDDGSNPLGADPVPENGKDTVDGGEGNDVIFGADDDDVLSGGAGNDTIDGEIDDDLIDGGTGDDSLLGGQGDDTIDGGDGDDLVDGGIGDDALSGGADQDTFVNVNAGDDVDGGSEGDDFDTLDLRGSAPAGGSLEVTLTGPDSNGNGFDGFVTYFDNNGDVTGTLNFEEIEEVIPCFTPGTLIATPRGEVRVEELEVGDRVVTRDNGIQEIRWVGQRSMAMQELAAKPQFKPVMIKRGALGNGLPERDMMVSPNHRVLLASEQAELLFEEREVLVAAKHLIGMEGVAWADAHEATYIHIMFDQHEVILSDGAWTESFQPGDMSLKGVGDAQREEILALFPELETQVGIEAYTAARRILKKHEAALLRH